MDLEKLATSAVKDSISVTETMSPFVNEGDKEPVWDGNIYIFQDSSKKKDGIKKVPVQVKGKKSNNLKAKKISYSLGVSYLRSYLQDGGVFFFVVHIGDNGLDRQIYYSALTPIKLRILLSNLKKNQTTKSFDLLPFPEDNNKKTSILLNFYEHMKKQTSFSNAQLLSEEELRKQGLIEAITIPFIGYRQNDLDARDILLQMDEVYMYATIKGTDILQPLIEMPIDLHIYEQDNKAITVNGKRYYSTISRVKSKDKTIVTVGKSTTLTIRNDSFALKIDIKPTSILRDALVDIPFLLDMANHGHFEIDGGVISLGEIGDKVTKERLEILKSRYEFCQYVSKLFKRLRLNENFDLSRFTDEDYKNTRRLYEALIEGKKVSGLKKDIPYFVAMDYADTKLALLFKKTEEPGVYEISDFFSDRSYAVYRLDENKNRFPSSKYVNFKAEHFLMFGNTDYDDIIESFSSYKDEPNCSEEATFLLLQMILAYDQSNDKRKDILADAEKFAKWILDSPPLNNDTNIAKINYYQIQKRNRDLTKEEQEELIAIAERTNLEDKMQEYSVKVGAYLLLDNKQAAEFYYKMLNKTNQEVLKQYPIYRFWDKSTEEDK